MSIVCSGSPSSVSSYHAAATTRDATTTEVLARLNRLAEAVLRQSETPLARDGRGGRPTRVGSPW